MQTKQTQTSALNIIIVVLLYSLAIILPVMAIMADINNVGIHIILFSAAAISLLLASLVLFQHFKLSKLEYESNTNTEQLIRLEKLATSGLISLSWIHEAKNPLTAIIGFLQYAQRDGIVHEKRMEVLSLAEQESLRCKSILENFLNLVKNEPLQKQEISLSVLLDEVKPILTEASHINKSTLIISYDPNLPSIQINKDHMKQVLLNLLLNALDACGSDGKIYLQAKTDLNSSTIIIRDNGTGISPDLQNRIYEPFYTTKQANGGIGLGLYISKIILEQHDANLEILSDGESGTTCKITFNHAPGKT